MPELGTVADVATLVATRGDERRQQVINTKVNAALRECESICRLHAAYLRGAHGHHDRALFADAVLVEIAGAAFEIQRAQEALA